jgi:exonuclease SbcD
MRILHTSDWHLGRSFHGEDLLAAQAAFVDHLLATVAAEDVDLVVLSGDVYDRALPPVDAVALADEALARLAASPARTVVTSGNHDSALRLGFNARLADHAGVHLRTDHRRVGEPVLLEDQHGVVAVHGLPYLEPDVMTRAWDLPSRSHEAAIDEAVTRVRADLATRSGARSVVLAHAFVTAGGDRVADPETSESERDISVGGVSRVPASAFDGIDYVALGHLHGRATLSESVRYSGSPLAYSFSEATHVKGSWLVDLGARGVTAAEFVEAPVPRRVARLTGAIDDLLADPRHAPLEDAWLQVTLTDPGRPAGAMDRLRVRFPHVVALHFSVPQQRDPARRTPVVGASAHRVALDFVEHVRGHAATEVEAALLQEALDCCPEDRDLLADHALVGDGR